MVTKATLVMASVHGNGPFMVQKGYIREWSMRMGHSNGLLIVPFTNGRFMVPIISPVTVTFVNATF